MVGTISCAVKNEIVKLISGGDALVIPVSLMTEFYIYPEGRSEKKSYVVYTVTIKTAFGSPHEIMPEANGFVNEVSFKDEYARTFFEEAKAKELFTTHISLSVSGAIENHNMLCRKVFEAAMRQGLTPEEDYERLFPEI